MQEFNSPYISKSLLQDHRKLVYAYVYGTIKELSGQNLWGFNEPLKINGEIMYRVAHGGMVGLVPYKSLGDFSSRLVIPSVTFHGDHDGQGYYMVLRRLGEICCITDYPPEKVQTNIPNEYQLNSQDTPIKIITTAI